MPELAFLPDAVEVSRLTAGGDVIWFGATQELAADEVAEIRAYARMAKDDDRNGRERVDLLKGVPLHSVWVAVDLATGATASGAPEGYPLRRVPWRGAGLRRLETGDEVADIRQTANLLVVRRGIGAWLVEAGDGGPADLDRAVNGAVRLAIADLEPVGNTTAAAPRQLASGDVVVMLDPRSLELTMITVAN